MKSTGSDKDRPTSFGSRESTSSSQSDQSVRSARAAKVFGELVSQGDNENSLCYSPSPFTKKQGLSNITNVCSSSPILPFGTIQFKTVKKVLPKKDMAKENESKKKEKNDDLSKTESRNEKNIKNRKKPKTETDSISLKSDVATSNNRDVQKSVPKNKNKNLPKRRLPLLTKHRYSSTHQAQASRAQMAILKATESVNESINASRVAKLQHDQHIAQEVARLKEEWRADREDAENFFAEIQKTKREMLDVKNKLSSQYAQNKVGLERSRLQQRLAELDKEIKFKSNVHVEHQRKMKENEDKRRRISVGIKSYHRNCRKVKSEELRLQSIQEQHEFYEHKWAGERDAEEYKKQCEKERRESLAFRNAEGRRQRMEEAERQATVAAAKSKRLEHKWAGERDAEEYKKQCEKERRDSFAFRNAEGRRQRLEEEQREENEKIKQHEFFEHKWAGERDAEEYRKQCEKERRDSFAFRNAEGRRQRLEEEQREENEKIKQHEFFEHKWAGERDAEEYRKQCEKERRESLALRGREHVHHRAVIAELEALAKEKEHEFFVLKWAAEDDTKAYLAEMAEERRKSFAFRNKEGVRHRQLEEEWRCEEIQKGHELEEMRSANQKDVEEYKRQCAERDRASLCFRGKELQAQRMIIQEKEQDEYEVEQRRRELETLARSDVEEYIKDCRRRRRMSLAVRATEHRRHLEWKRGKAEAERKEKSKRSKNAALDRKYVELAKEKERARIALDALRHARCTFSSSNPFGSLLE